MKQLTKSKKIMVLIAIIILIAGIAITIVKGLNFDLKYQETQSVQLYIGEKFNEADIRQITNEVLPNQAVMLEKVEIFQDTVIITAKEITEEQKNNLVTKINEKYEADLKAEEIQITNIPHTRLRDIMLPYVVPFVIAVVIVLIYMGVRYYKLGVGKVLAQTIGLLILTQALLFSVIAIARIPIGRLTIPMVLMVYMLTLIGITTKMEKQLANKKQEENKKEEK